MPLPPAPDRASPPHGTPPSGPRGIWETWSNRRLLLWTVLLIFADFTLQGLFFQLTNRLYSSVAAGSLVAVLLPCFLLARIRGGNLASEFDLGRVPWSVLGWAALAAVGSLLPASLLAQLSVQIHPPPESWVQLFEQHMPQQTTGIALALFAVMVAGPVAEELLFRGLIYRLARRLWGSSAAAVLSALAFGLLHGEPWYLFGLVGLGLLLAYIYEMTGSLTPGVITHSVYNGLSFVLLLENQDLATSASGVNEFDVLLVVGSLLLLAFACTHLARGR
jgi:membrane protease YdiL (CAAX protease family)